MREARLVGLSQDGTQLILALAETGEEFAVPVDDRLRAALRGDRARLGQLEIQMESALRPRDIQARIRAGESPEAVAAIAQMPMERVMAFAGPVLAERDHIASLAQRASVRRRGGGDAPTRNLGAWVTDRLRTRHVDPASAEWDAWRREDGRWAVRVSYFVESEDEAEKKDEKIAMFAYDAPGRYAVPDDDEARWLVGEQAQVLATPAQPQPGERRLAAVADIDPLLAPDHGADSYEAGFEDTVGLRRRNHPAAREDTGHQTRDFVRESRELSRDVRETREPSRDARDYPREVARDLPREPGRGGAREPERGPRRVHSVPNPDEEPTLIDVPVDQPPAPRPAVRAVERPADPPAFASPAAPDETPAESRQARPAEERTAEARTAEPRAAEPRRAEPTAEPSRSAEARRPEPAPSSTPGPAPHIEPDPVTEAPQPAAAEASTEETPAEPKKKAARRGKRASVPSWDEIMFGKKAD
ncbi:septation protein SepH [Kribbella sp. NBC_00709]|uniref:septation protein SepH n=1 Tax=Kribbella sp. NBC_00709 TaxID=2975972 RepID=UPI002E28FBB8|nr:septation protein SepH [Kribbella sp. NBC_00709]